MKHVGMLSGGLVSWMTCKTVAKLHGTHDLSLLFADTIIEDEDLYRFLVEGAAEIMGCGAPREVVDMAKSIPSLDDMAERKYHLRRMAFHAMEAIPGFHWVTDGRTPWEVFHDTKFLGNARVAKCSHVLKQKQCREWLERECNPDDTTVYVGMSHHESHRFHGKDGKAGARELWLPWKCEAPLLDDQIMRRYHIVNYLGEAGIDPPRLYEMGAAHNNCGMFCVRAGQGQFELLHREMPERYRHHEGQEQAFRENIGKDVAILRDRRGGKTIPMTLLDFRERLECGEKGDGQFGVCGCFVAGLEEEFSQRSLFDSEEIS